MYANFRLYEVFFVFFVLGSMIFFLNCPGIIIFFNLFFIVSF